MQFKDSISELYERPEKSSRETSKIYLFINLSYSAKVEYDSGVTRVIDSTDGVILAIDKDEEPDEAIYRESIERIKSMMMNGMVGFDETADGTTTISINSYSDITIL